MTLLFASLCLTSCIFFAGDGGGGGAVCDANELCFQDEPQVCGEDGVTYECAEQASCENVGVDDSGRVCGGDFCGNQLPPGCNLFCANDNYATDTAGCLLCECAAACPRPTTCSPKSKRVCEGMDPSGCVLCRCEAR